MLTLFRIRCPSCGMTTSWAHATRGHWLRAFRSNAGGAMLAGLSMLVAPWALVSAARGAWTPGKPREAFWVAVAFSIVVVTLVEWFIRLRSG